jgi:pimeloyl-ACP methyl ester carboxylesterase
MNSGSGSTNSPEGGLAPVEPKALIGYVKNVAHQAPKWLFDFGTYELAIVEFDDQGICHDAVQMRGLRDKMIELGDRGEDIIIVVFAHGWKHDARTDDSNICDFRTKVLERVVEYEKQQAAAQNHIPRPVLGVFIGWRGMSLYDSRLQWLENITFWTRQSAGRRVAAGSVRELAGHLRNYHRKRKDDKGEPLFVVVGHSFGGMIVYSALAQALIEAAATPKIPPTLADLVLLVNPAIEAARYLPIHALAGETQQKTPDPQPPIFVCVTARNDYATRWAFPLGNWFSSFMQYIFASSGQKEKDKRQREAIRNTIGHVPWLKTHDLAAANPQSRTDVNFTLSPPADDLLSPMRFWVVQATPEVVNHHSEIFGDRFLYFVARLVFRHADKTKGRSASAEAEAHALGQNLP